jgi:L-fuconolactonase
MNSSSNNCPIIDTAVHLWDAATYPRMHGDWLDSRPELKRSWLPADLEKELLSCQARRAVIIEAARDFHSLNLWWLDLARQHTFLGPVMVGCRFEHPNLIPWLDAYSQYKQFAGIRTMPPGPPSDWNEDPVVANGLRELAQRNLCLELLVSWQAFPAVACFANAYPHLRIILDHCGMPPFNGDSDQWLAWSKGLESLADYPNVTVKYSSLLLYADPVRELSLLRRPADFLLETFGPTRLMWGSNWPVELRYGSYRETFELMQACVGPLSSSERTALYSDTAVRAYKISL